MNNRKQKILLIENGQLKIHNRALEDRLATTEKQLSDKMMHLAVVCLAFKNYIKQTSSPNAEPMTDEQAVDKLNALVKDAVTKINEDVQPKETQRND